MTRCFVCGCPATERHHVLYGNANRKLSDKYGLVVGLCYNHHRGNEGVHFNKRLDYELKSYAHKKFIEHYPDEDFLTLFGKNYFYAE